MYKNRFFVHLLIAAFLFVPVCGVCLAENPESEEVICGGWMLQPKIDADALDVFQKAAEQVKSYSLAPISCSTQVVAGINYCFLCTVKPKKSPSGRVAYGALNVYQNLQGNVEVTNLRIIPMNAE